jgi:RNA polymerase sigma factor (sigma-70 family)
LGDIKRHTEEELVSHLLSADTRRFGFLYDYFSADLLGIIYRIVKDEKVAEDILQESFIKIWNAASSYDAGRSRLFTWMLNIARNSSIDYLRSKQGKADKISLPASTQIASEEPHFVVEDTDTGLTQIVRNLKKDQHDVITLGFFEGYTQAEIAEKLQIPLGTVKTRCRAALKELREKYKRENN